MNAPNRMVVDTAVAAALAVASSATAGHAVVPGEPSRDPLAGESLYADVRRYEGFGIHRYGSPGAERALDWIAAELRLAGFEVAEPRFAMPRQYDLHSATLEVGGQVLQVLPQWWLPAAAERLDLTARIVPQGPAPGGFVRLSIPFDRGAYLNERHRQALQAAFDRQPAAVLLTIEHNSGENFTYNVNQTDAPWPVPVILVPPRHRPLLDTAEAAGQPVTVRIDGTERRDVPGRNVVARLNRGAGRALVISTPVTGWHVNTCERGPGIAVFLALARVAAQRLPNVDLIFVATAGHEIGHGGMEQFLHHGAPKPADTLAWTHLGASLACHAWRREGGQWVTDGALDASLRLLNASTSMAPLVQAHFAAIEGRRLVGAQAAIGELREIHAAGYPHWFGMAGGHLFFHTTQDTSAATSPRILEPAGRAFAAALEALARSAAR